MKRMCGITNQVNYFSSVTKGYFAKVKKKFCSINDIVSNPLRSSEGVSSFWGRGERWNE